MWGGTRPSPLGPAAVGKQVGGEKASRLLSAQQGAQGEGTKKQHKVGSEGVWPQAGGVSQGDNKKMETSDVKKKKGSKGKEKRVS